MMLYGRDTRELNRWLQVTQDERRLPITTGIMTAAMDSPETIATPT
ncbi:hypothetical protein [Halostreptopolyspora alba]